ncbi:hypothetical protein, partial [Desulfosporosinus sp.]|uniref:hypothetical protein n=1 Tax=Desulfosporosinus sp. TaxID=157907 RepID=UPI002604B5D8
MKGTKASIGGFRRSRDPQRIFIGVGWVSPSHPPQRMTSWRRNAFRHTATYKTLSSSVDPERVESRTYHTVSIYTEYQYTQSINIHRVSIYTEYQYTQSINIHRVSIYTEYQYTQ